MHLPDYITWYNRQAFWLRMLLIPILIPVILVHGMLAMLFFALLMPFVIGKGAFHRLRFRHRLKKQGRIGRWEDVKHRIGSPAGNGSATLVVELLPGGLGNAWLIDQSRDVLDPEHAALSWSQASQLDDWPDPLFDAVKRWESQHLAPHAATAKLLRPSRRRIENLGPLAAKSSVLVVPFGLTSGDWLA